jgi:hypothetical protein
MVEYMLYANGDYYCCDDYDEHPSYMSDDFMTVEVPDDVDVDDYMVEYQSSVDLGECCEQRKKF